MSNQDASALQEEVEQFKKEKEKIRQIIGDVGGRKSNRRDQTINMLFIGSVAVLFIVDFFRHALKLDIPIPPLFSVELGLLLVSIKIIWMIHKQTRVEHFQFWILNSIEFRLNDLSKQAQKIEARISDGDGNETGTK